MPEQIEMLKLPDPTLMRLVFHYESARGKDLRAPMDELRARLRADLFEAERALCRALFRAKKSIYVDGYCYASDGIDLRRFLCGKPRRKTRSGPRNRTKGRTDA